MGWFDGGVGGEVVLWVEVWNGFVKGGFRKEKDESVVLRMIRHIYHTFNLLNIENVQR